MLKSQYIIIAIGVFLVVGLFMLPKSVVSNKNKNVEQTESEKPTDSQEETAQNATSEMHSNKLTQEQSILLDRLRPQFFKAQTEQEKSLYFDSLSLVYRPANLMDSLAFYAENLANQFPNTRTFLATADAYYEVFSFAMSEQKIKQAAEKARNYYEKILAQEPDNSDVKVKLGVTYTITATPMQGIQIIREVLNKEPDNQLALFNLGLLSMQSGQYDKAVERFEKLIAINPRDVNACLLLGQSLVNLNKTKEAIEKMEKFKANLTNSPIDTEIKQKIDMFLKDVQK
ncbi:tetratricopeptide repeat protein [Thermoflexibacter ruber]|uniref:Cytochrome c-type biogenesis protein CcmH/NrfG n=1 Tax=Thermoflexibacter ruber TaxID=1003 RepID=A0A1I2HV84_9BACT|nr:tetratricopeptide repeat protein [Thermoflexibacter ruber]SFF32647.1 Cytochrome c-type biogenesis protein CcmH/NrfG [Thermoflexibacter ruber]